MNFFCGFRMKPQNQSASSRNGATDNGSAPGGTASHQQLTRNLQLAMRHP
jgi:hypothetical protein